MRFREHGGNLRLTEQWLELWEKSPGTCGRNCEHKLREMCKWCKEHMGQALGNGQGERDWNYIKGFREHLRRTAATIPGNLW
jgi:hypothetical protein